MSGRTGHRHVSGFWLATIAGSLLVGYGSSASCVEFDGPPMKLVRIVPRTESELSAAFGKAAGSACEQVDADEPLEITSFMPYLSARDSTDGLPVSSSRRHALTVGLDMLRSDENDLPLVSRGKILEYLNDHFVSVQAREQRDLATDKLYLHDRPMAIVARFRGPKLTQGFEALVAESVRDIRSLGLYVKSRTRLKPEDMRTMVLVHKNTFFDDTLVTGTTRTKPNYELAFIHARDVGKEDQLEIHSFCTSHQRRQWHYLNPGYPPTRPIDCSIRGTITFTDFKYGLVPAASVTRNFHVRARSSYRREDLSRYLASHSLNGEVYDNNTEILYAVID